MQLRVRPDPLSMHFKNSSLLSGTTEPKEVGFARIGFSSVALWAFSSMWLMVARCKQLMMRSDEVTLLIEQLCPERGTSQSRDGCRDGMPSKISNRNRNRNRSNHRCARSSDSDTQHLRVALAAAAKSQIHSVP